MDGGGAQKPQKPPEAQTEPPKPPASPLRKALYFGVGLLILAGLITGGVLYWLDARHYATTDDAFIDGHISQVSPQVAARVIRIAVADNAEVKAGDLLVELDPRDYQVKLDQARAQRAQAVAERDQAAAQIAVRQASIDQAVANQRVAEAQAAQAQTEYARDRAVNPQAISRQQVDDSSASARSAAARVEAAKQSVAGARAELEGQRAQVAAADANIATADVAVANAVLQLSYTHVIAPQDGRVTKRTVELGNYVTPGQPLLAIVADAVWVTANFKETQLADIRPNQPVRVLLDSCPGRDFAAHVDSFQAGSGNAFSALPAENATGNFVKVVQRVPVKIVFNEPPHTDCWMAPGMSVTPRVTVR